MAAKPAAILHSSFFTLHSSFFTLHFPTPSFIPSNAGWQKIERLERLMMVMMPDSPLRFALLISQTIGIIPLSLAFSMIHFHHAFTEASCSVWFSDSSRHWTPHSPTITGTPLS